MKLRITGILLSVLFAFAYTAGAAPVTAEEARLAARGWSLANGATFGDFGAVKSVIAEPAADGGTLWYVVVTEHGAAVVASDDEIEPVIAFIPGCDGSIPEASPLRAMLKRDLTARRAKATAVAKAKLAAAAPAAASAEANKWRTLKTIATMKMLNAQGNPATIVRWLDGWNSGDTKVVDGKRIQTLRFWNQTDSPNYFTDDEIFNHYTPLCVNASLGHATCGCVATAGSAVMHYFRMVGREPVTGWCTVGPTAGIGPEPDIRILETMGGPYDWSLIDNLDLKAGEPVQLSEAQLDLLARVASDCGLGCGMNYDSDGRGSSGSYSSSLARSFRNVFDIRNVQLVTVDGENFGWGTDIGRANYDDIIYNQIRGGAPVVLGIEGHEVVATGYGIDANHTDYTYIFLGWGGANDAWYALPKIDTKATLEGGWYESTFVDELLTMISPDDHFVSVVGRVLQYDGSAAAGAVVTLSDGQVLTADENGYWGTRVAPTADGAGTVTVAFPGCPEKTVGYTIGELARTTDEDNARIASDLAQALPDALEIRLEDPCVRVEGQEFSTLNEALDYVGENLPHDQPAVIEIFREGRFLLEDYTLPFDCIIRSPAGMTNRITRTSGVKLIVGEGCTLTLENIRFNACGRQALAVANDATLILSGDVAAEEIFLDERATLRLTGTPNPANGYVIDAPAKAARGAFVATYDGAWDDFQHIAGNFANKYDRELRGKAVKLEAGYGVKWEVVPVPTAQAVGSLTQNGETVNFDDLRLLFRMIGETGDAEVVIFGDRELTLTNSVEIAGRKVTVRSKAGLATLNGAGTKNRKNERIGFTVRDGGCLVLDHVTFKDYKVWDRPFVFVDDGIVDFKYGAGLDNVIVGRQIGMTNELGCATFNPVYVKKGTVTIEPGAAIVNCATKPTTVVSGTSIPGHGGAVYLHGEECELELAGEISKCSASDYGGAVYAATGAKIKLSDYANVQDNVTVTTVTSKSDIYIREPDAIVVTGPLKGQRVGVYHAKLANPPTGQQFAIADSAAAMSGAELSRTAQVFFNDRKPTLGAKTNGAVFVWGEAGTYVEPEALEPPADPWPEPEPDPEPEPEPEPEPGPGPGPGPGPEPTPVECQPFAFTAIVEQADHSWKLTLAPATTYCKYTLKTSDDLVNWTTVGEPKTMQSTDLFEFTVPGEEAKRFWKVIGEDGVEPISE